MPLPLELVVYIHGVSGGLEGRYHTPEYEQLHEGIAERNDDWPIQFLGVEWGWNHDGGTAKSHQLLTDAQRKLGARAIPALMDPSDFTLNPARLVVNNMRPLMFYGFGDMLYYVSESGKTAVRNAVATQIINFIDKEVTGDDTVPISLTVLGHSAGSVIAFDFLFSLFYQGEDHVFVKMESGEDACCEPGMQRLRNKARNRTLRLRRLITFGSPITLLACRSDAVLEILAQNKKLNPVDYGLNSTLSDADPVSGVRWINLWDRDDPIAWPIEPLMNEINGQQVAEDIYIDVSDSITKAHDLYWGSSLVHNTIAGRW